MANVNTEAFALKSVTVLLCRLIAALLCCRCSINVIRPRSSSLRRVREQQSRDSTQQAGAATLVSVSEVGLSTDVAFVSLSYGSVCVRACGLFPRRWKGVGKSKVRVTGRVSSRHEPLDFLNVAGCRASL